MQQRGTFTSESVSEGHPDKIADQISDAILDALLTHDQDARAAVETMVKTGMVIVSGEVTTSGYVDIEDIVRKIVIDIGYNRGELGFDGHCISVLNAIGKQSEDIARGVIKQDNLQQGAGDQGMMFGYASNETPTLMPAPIYYAHQLMLRQASLRKEGTLPWLRPDAKAQVTVHYEKGYPCGIESVVLSTQHDPDIPLSHLHEAIQEELIKNVLPNEWLSKNTRYHINPTGRFIEGGPVADCGLTGRKIMVDTYGSMARHGGGAFSGKDPSKVDRSGAYMCRYIAKNIVESGLARCCEVQLSYSIGIAEPTSLHINTFGTGKIDELILEQTVRKHFDLTPNGIIEALNLKQPIYLKTASYGHFGRTNDHFPWEKTDKAELLTYSTL